MFSYVPTVRNWWMSTNSRSNSIQTCANRIVWALTTKKSTAWKTIQSKPSLRKTCTTSHMSLLPACLLAWNGSGNCNQLLIQRVHFFPLALQVYACRGILVTTWHQLKFGSGPLFQLLGCLCFSFFWLGAMWQKPEGERWKYMFWPMITLLNTHSFPPSIFI